MTFKALALTGIMMASLVVPAFAHHSFAIFDQTKVNTITGTVKEFELVNPHVWLHVAFTDEKGQAATWSFEGGSVAQLQALGWKKENFPVGERVEVAFRPMKDGSRGGQLMSAKPANGQKVCSNRGCGDGSGGVLAPF